MKKGIHAVFLLSVLLLFGCKELPVPPSQFVPGRDAGGANTIYSQGPDAFTFALPGLSSEEAQRHLEADGAFAQSFVTAPADNFSGLGPLYNQNSCESCHTRNGRGDLPQSSVDVQHGFLLRMSLPGTNPEGGNVPVPGFGTQFQHRASFGVDAEGELISTPLTQTIEFADGTTKTLTYQHWEATNTYLPLPSNTQFSPRVAPPVHGLGLIEAIPEENILARVDEDDANQDGISGKANFVWDYAEGGLALGRYGWKAGQPTALQQAADAAHNDMGLTSNLFPEEHCDGQSNCTTGLNPGPDLDDETLHLMAFYFESLAVPAARNLENEEVAAGYNLFNEAGCTGCHIPEQKTGTHEISALSNQTIYPYTDLLLHDMGPGLADNRGEFLANGQEWRTSPLWGIGLTQVVNPNATFLHDGRAKTLEEAILWHGGEAESSRDYYTALSQEDRAKLIRFLEAL